MKLDIDIDRLAVPGITPLTRHRLTVALEDELDRLVGSHGLPDGWQAGTIAIDQASIEVAPASSAAEIGVQVARQLFTDLHRETADKTLAPTREDR